MHFEKGLKRYAALFSAAILLVGSIVSGTLGLEIVKAADPEITETVNSYDFSSNSGKAAPELGKVLAGTDTKTSGILYAKESTGSCTFDSNCLKFRQDVILYLPIKDDTTKIKYAAKGTGDASNRPTYLGNKDSGYTVPFSKKEQSCTIEDITDYIVVVDGKKYFPIISGGDVKLATMKLYEYNPINSVTVSGTVKGAAENGIKKITFKNLDNSNAEKIVVELDAAGKYSTTLRRVAGNTNYVASISATGFKLDETSNAFTLTGNAAKADFDFSVVAAPILKISGSLTGIPDSALKGELGLTLISSDNTFDPVEVALTKTSDGSYTYKDVAVEHDLEYSVVLTNADDYEVSDKLCIKTGEFTGTKNETYNIKAELKALQNVSGKFVTSDSKSAKVSSITFTNMDTPDYSYTFDVSGDNYSAKLRAGEYETSVVCEGYTVFDHVSVKEQAVSNDVYLKAPEDTSEVEYKEEVKVGKGQEFTTIASAVNYITRMKRGENDRVIVLLTDELYREQIIINTPNITFKSALENGSTITWYYGVNFSYYSANSEIGVYYDEAYAVDKYYKSIIGQTPGHWGATVNLFSGAKGFKAENITFENSLNRYLTEEELIDGAGANTSAAVTDRTKKDIDVRIKASKERACVLYIQADDTEYFNCRLLSSQDTLFTGDDNESSYFKNCFIEGTTDYICGDGNPVFDECTLSMYSYTDQASSGGYIVASKANGKFGYLFNNCKIVACKDEGLKKATLSNLARTWGPGILVYKNTEVEDANTVHSVAYQNMGSYKVEDAHYSEYNTHLPDGTKIDTSKRPAAVKMLTDEEAEAIKIETYLDGFWPYHFPVACYGDANGDKIVDVRDAILLKKFLAGNALDSFNEPAMNVNVDDRVNATDAIILMKYLAKMNVKLGEK